MTRAAAEALLAGLRSRGEVKRAAQAIASDPALRDAMLELAAHRKIDVAPDLDARRLVRALLDREDASRVVRNPTRIDEAFRCGHCDRDVPALGHTSRDHCPWCLRSLHVDVVPGDRAAGCGGLLDPVGLVIEHGLPIIRFRCRRCGADKRNRAAVEGDPPDDAQAILRLSRGEVP